MCSFQRAEYRKPANVETGYLTPPSPGILWTLSHWTDFTCFSRVKPSPRSHSSQGQSGMTSWSSLSFGCFLCFRAFHCLGLSTAPGGRPRMQPLGWFEARERALVRGHWQGQQVWGIDEDILCLLSERSFPFLTKVCQLTQQTFACCHSTVMLPGSSDTPVQWAVCF